MYLKISTTDEVYHYCRLCGHREEPDTKKGIMVYKKSHSKTNDWKRCINAYTKYDPTLPRIKEINCPSCDKNDEVIKIRYDDRAMKFAYLCGLCDASWITE